MTPTYWIFITNLCLKIEIEGRQKIEKIEKILTESVSILE